MGMMSKVVLLGFSGVLLAAAGRGGETAPSARPCNLPAFGEPIPGPGYDPSKPDCGMSAAAVFDRPLQGLAKIGTLAVPAARDVPGTSAASIGFEGLDRRLFEPTAEVYARLGACGVKWARVQTMWSRCEREKGVYDFSELDAVVDGLRAVGIRPWFSVTFGNTLYMSNCYTKAAVGCVPLYYGEECRAAWLAYVRALARRYHGKVTHWEIWNEANIAHFWQPRAPNAHDYVELVKITGAAIRAEHPAAKIGAGNADSGIREWERAFFAASGAPFFVYYAPFDFSRAYEGKVYAARTDAQLAVPEAVAPEDPVLVDLLRGGVYAVASGRREGNRTVFAGLPLVDYPLVLAPRAAVPLKPHR